MFDSLVIANTVELLNGGVTSTNPLCPGAKFQLQPGASPGAPQPTTDYVASLLLDGERPFGRRASNRTITMPIWITAPNRAILAAAREVLQQAVDQDFFTITWTRDPLAGNPGNTPLPLVFDCFRAQPTVAVFNTLREKDLIGQQVQVTIPALPYGRSDTQVQVSFTSPAPTNPQIAPPPTPVVLDNFSAISSVQCFQSTQCVIGPFTCGFDPDRFGDFGGQETAFNYQAELSSVANLAGMTSLQMWFGLGSRYWSNLEFHGKTHGTTFAFTLTDSSGKTLSFSKNNVFVPVSQSAQVPLFTRITIPVPQGNPVFNYASVVAYSMTITNRQDRIPRLSWVTAYIDALTAYPGSQQVVPVVRGAVYTIYGVVGTARAPVTMSFQQPPSAGTATTITAAGAGTYTVPINTAYLKGECWGAGGAGAGMTAAGVGAGAGGGEYASDLLPATSGQVVPYVNGAGAAAGATPANGQSTVLGPVPGSTLQITANGGGSVPTNGSTAGQGGTGSPNGTEHPGGAGRSNPTGTFGGGGGSSGGPNAAGNTPMGSGSVLFTATGSSSWTCPAGVFQVLAECWGAGGGAGGGGASGNGQGGGGGEYRASLVNVTPGSVYHPFVGSGGNGGALSANGTNGTASSFAGDSGTVTANPGLLGLGNVTFTPSNGGSGGSGATGFNGGRGGDAYPYTGGGGSSAGPSAAGNSGSSPNGATAPTGGGNGGNGSGANNTNPGSSGSAPGGGGGGAWDAAGGAGAAGQVRLTYPATTGAPTSSGGVAVTGGGSGGAGGATPGSAGAAGSAPGGAGGGANSSGTTVAGGAGANGQVKITPFSAAAFKTLIVHRPPLGALKTFQPLVSVGGGSDPPDGTHQYTMPQPTTGVNADFGGTYTILLVNNTWSGGSGSSTTRNIFVTVTQFEYAGGPGYALSTLPVTVAPNQVSNGIVTAGVLTLPIKAVAPDNTGGYYTVSVTDSNTSDRWYDCILVDTMGQTVVINEPTSGYVTYYVDAPDPNVSLGRIMGSQSGRGSAISVMDNTPYISGGPLFVEPSEGDNQLFVYCADGVAPNVSLSYFPTYYFDRTQ